MPHPDMAPTAGEVDPTPPLHPVLAAAFTALEQAAVCWCLLRLPADPAAPRGDVDLLVDPDGAGRLPAILAPLGLVRLPAVGSGFEHVFLSYHAATDCWIRLHAVTELSFGPSHFLRTGSAPACLARRERGGGPARLRPEDAFWVTLLHCLLDKGAVAGRHRARLRELAEEVEPDGPLRPVVERACPAGWDGARLVGCVRQGDWDALEALASTWRRRPPLGARLGGALRWSVRLLARLAGRWRRRGLSVAVVGPDGAGKSTLAAGLGRSFFCPARTIYMGFGVSGGSSRPPLLARLRLPALGAPGRLLVLWWRFLEARYHQARGRLVIFDRYTYDALAPPPGRRGWLRRLSPWLKARACPAPDVLVVLDVPGRVMFERKGDLSPEVLEFQRQRFRELEGRFPRTQVIDATRPAEAVRIDVTDRLWRLYAARWLGPGRARSAAE